MQAALAWSPTNKAFTPIPNSAFGDVLIIQEYQHEHYRFWIVPAKEIPLWSGLLNEQEIDTLPEKYGVDPGKKVWMSMGLAPDNSVGLAAIETALQTLSGMIVSLRTEHLAIKALLAEKKEGNSSCE